jgi:hypothetical protein
MLPPKSSLDFDNRARLLNLVNPIEDDEATTKDYVDDLAAAFSVYNSFGYVSSNYTLLEGDLGKIIEVNTTSADVTVTLPSGLASGWWCTVVKESNNNLIYFTSTLPLVGKGTIFNISRTPALLMYNGAGYWRIIGSVVT